jgi:hypothetical protein
MVYLKKPCKDNPKIKQGDYYETNYYIGHGSNLSIIITTYKLYGIDVLPTLILRPETTDSRFCGVLDRTLDLKEHSDGLAA